MRKIMEKAIYNRLLPVVESINDVSERPHGFRWAYTILNAIRMMANLARGTFYSGSCAVLALDVKHAFNFVNCNRIKGVLVDMVTWCSRIFSEFGQKLLPTVLGTYCIVKSLHFPSLKGLLYQTVVVSAWNREEMEICATETVRALKHWLKR